MKIAAGGSRPGHRIGHDQPVFVYKLIAEVGIETAIEQLEARKAALADALFAPLVRKTERRAA